MYISFPPKKSAHTKDSKKMKIIIQRVDKSNQQEIYDDDVDDIFGKNLLRYSRYVSICEYMWHVCVYVFLLIAMRSFHNIIHFIYFHFSCLHQTIVIHEKKMNKKKQIFVWKISQKDRLSFDNFSSNTFTLKFDILHRSSIVKHLLCYINI